MTKYVIITAARDEEAHIEETIQSVVAQTVKPVQWIIVNDGSADNTGAIIDRYAKAFPWITAVHRANRGFREAGGGVISAFYEGYARVQQSAWEFIVKLDADLSFAADYFEKCFAEFENDPRLGIGGGGIYHQEGDRLVLEPNPIFHVRGATKIYKRECWEKLGGLWRAPGWDTIDELKANMLGWTTRTFPQLEISHHRFTGAADGAWRDCVKNGRANYITGYHPLFMVFKCIRRLFRRPYITGSLGLWWGFFRCYFVHTPRVDDLRVIRYTRAQQMRRLLCLESIWK